MTYIITVRTKESILMASDTRLDYHHDKIINGEKYQEITATADCIRKTFFINKAKVGIQFLGIGYFPADGEKYPLSHFISELYGKKYGKDFETNARTIFNFFKEISKEGDTGQYVKGIISGFSKNNKSYVCTFNTYNNDFEIKEFNEGQFVDSENNINIFPHTEPETIEEINKRIKAKSVEKYWNIGGPVEILKITHRGGVFIQENKNLFYGTQKELENYFNNDIRKIDGQVLQTPYLEKYHF